MKNMQEYNLIAPFYDIEHASFSEDLDIYSNYAELAGGKILELACGTGRALLPLARAGYQMTGVDSSTAMLDLARQQVESEGLVDRCRLVEQDMRTLELNQKFRLAFIALGSFGHIITRRDQQSTLTAIRAHLSYGGTFILDISNGDVRYMESMSGQMLHQSTWPDTDQSYYTHFISPASATQHHLLELTHFYDRYTQGGPVQRTAVTTTLYLFERSEIELLLEQAGFVVKDIYGDYQFGSFQLDSPRLICIAEAR